MSSSMSLMRRLPPMHTIKNLAAICELIQDDEVRDDVMIKSDQPLRKYLRQSFELILMTSLPIV